jgi:hypothetical protein
LLFQIYYISFFQFINYLCFLNSSEVDSPDNALYFLALSLFIFSHDDWLTHRCEFLKRVIRLAHSLYNSEATDEKLIGPRNPSNFNLTNFSEPAVFSVYKPFIVYWIFIDQVCVVIVIIYLFIFIFIYLLIDSTIYKRSRMFFFEKQNFEISSTV